MRRSTALSHRILSREAAPTLTTTCPPMLRKRPLATVMAVSRPFSTGVASGPSPAGAAGDKTHFGYRDVPTEEKEKLVKEVFDSVASKYDVMNDLMSGGLHRVWKDEFVRMTGMATAAKTRRDSIRNLKLLDVAGGTGDIAFRLMKQAVDNSSEADAPEVTVFDINAKMLEVGQQRAVQAFPSASLRGRLNWVEGNAETLPFPDNTFDLYTIAYGLRNVTNRDKALKEAYRVLKPGGRFMCLEFSHVSLPVVQQVYEMYSFKVIPAIGEVVTGDRAAYQYLVESIRKFPRQEVLVQEIEQVGFSCVSYTNLTLGTTAVHSGFKFTNKKKSNH